MNPYFPQQQMCYQNNNENLVLARLYKEFNYCKDDEELNHIGCSFGLENNNIYNWKVTMTGPEKTPYEGGLFKISIIFPPNYPQYGPEFKFKNKIYHLNVDLQNNFGHICISRLNEWASTGEVKSNPNYNVKQALFDIFSLFYKQGVKSAYDLNMANDYMYNYNKFCQDAKTWTKQYAKFN